MSLTAAALGPRRDEARPSYKEQDMEDLNDNEQLPPIELLITACSTVDDAGAQRVWMHGYCLLTYREEKGTVHLDGDVRIGERYSANSELIQELAERLDPAAVLAGLDITGTVGRIGRLPIDADDQGPSRALLHKLKTMLAAECPIDLMMTETSQASVEEQALQHALTFNECGGDEPGIRTASGLTIRTRPDDCNPAQLAAELAEIASACLLAVGDLYLESNTRSQLIAAWQRWRRDFQQTLLC